MKREVPWSLSKALIDVRRKSMAVSALLWILACVGSGLCPAQPLEAAAPRVPSHALAYLEEGRREMQRGSYLRAIRLFSVAIQNGADAYQLRGEAYFRIGQRERALEDVSRHLSEHPSDPAAHLFRGDMAMADCNSRDALADYRIAVKLAPSSPDAYVSRGLAHMAQEQYFPAVRDFETALQIDPHNLDALSNLGVAHMLANRPGSAREWFNKAMRLETDPEWQKALSRWLSRLPQDADPRKDRDLPRVNYRSEGETEEPGREPKKGSSVETNPVHASLKSVESSSQERAGAGPHPAPARDKKGVPLSGKWDTTFMGAAITMEISQSGSDLSGVMRIQGPVGKDDTYHFNGTVGYEGTVKVAHHSGHHFEGRITDNGRIEGILTTKLGKRIPVDLSPRQANP